MRAVDLWEQAAERGSPLVSEVDSGGLAEVTFVWRGEAASTAVGWGARHELTRAPGTDVWTGTFRWPARMRTIYFVTHLPPGDWTSPGDPGGTGPAHVDPLNPGRMRFPADPGDPTDRDSWVSTLTLPHAPEETWCRPRPGVPAGTIEEAVLDGDRRVSVYVPPGGRRAGGPALVVFDGYLGRTVMGIPATLDNLLAAGRIPPVTALFVHGTDATRDRDLAPDNARTTHFVSRDLMAWARREYRTSPYPRDNALAGCSLGGLAAAAIALEAPDVFGGVLSQSGSFWWPAPGTVPDTAPQWLTREYARRPHAGLRFHLDIGSRETRPVGPGAPSQLQVSRTLRDVLRSRGYPVTYVEYDGWHDYVNWRNTFADGVVALFGH